MKLQYGTVPKRINQLYKPSPLTDPRRLDAQANQILREVAAQFAFFNSAARTEHSPEVDHASISDFVTSILAGAVHQPESITLADKRQRADAFAAHVVWMAIRHMWY